MLLNLTELSAEPMHSQVSRQLRGRISGGLPEARRGDGEPLGYESLEEVLRTVDDERDEAWLDRLLERVREETQPAVEDDWTAVLLASREL